MPSLDWALAGQCAHFAVLAFVVLGVVFAFHRLVAESSLQMRLAAGSALMLFGAVFRLTPLERQGRLIVAGVFMVVAAALAGWSLRGQDLRDLLRAAGPTRWLAAYGLAALPSVLIATDSLAAAGGAAGVMTGALVSAAVGVHFDRRTIWRLLGVVAFAGAVLALSSAVLTPSDAFQTIRSPIFTQRFKGWFPFIGLGWGHLGVGFVVIGLERERYRWPALIAAVLLIGATQARGAAIATVFVVLVWIGLAHRRRLPAVALLLAAGVVAGLAVGPVRDLWDREQAIAESDNIFTYRADFVRAALAVAESSPIIGRGIDSGTIYDFSDELDIGGPELVTATHMTWTTAIAGTGGLGLILLIGAFGSAWRWAVGQFRFGGDRSPVLLMVWMTASSFFITGAAELSAVGLVFAFAAGSAAMADGRAVDSSSAQPDDSVRALSG